SEPDAQARDAPSLACASGSGAFFLKKESAVTWRDRFRNAWDGFGWCATSVREAAMLQALRRAGIGCPQVAALGEAGRQAFVLTRAETALTDLRVLLPTLSNIDRNRLADALGRELARMHNAGFDHPDLFGKHILAAAEGDTFRICILDWQRGRRRRSVSWAMRWRDLAALDATLHDAVARDRLRLRCLRAYLQETTASPPLPRFARQVRAACEIRRRERRMRELGQPPAPAWDHQFVPLCESRLLMVRSYFERIFSRMSIGDVEPEAQAREWASLACASGSAILMDRWRAAGESWDIPPLAHTLFRLQRFGVPAPRLFAVGLAETHVFLIAIAAPTTPLSEAIAKAPQPMRSRLLRQAGHIVRRIHEAGYNLPNGDTWERRLGVASTTGEVVLTNLEPLVRGNASWQDVAPGEFNRQAFRLSRTEQLRFLQGYLQRKRSKATERQALT
ncbi:MAG: hypothetical protein HY289_10125, partial [Planctomycetes bacterium]|nr:hypothetical protein [Planctomycetota bacterium]